MKKIIFKLLFLALSFSIVSVILFNVFKPIFTANSLIFPYAVHPFDIAKVYPETWNLLKKLYFISSFFSFFILFNKLFSILYSIFPKSKQLKKEKLTIDSEDLSLFLGMENNLPYFISEKRSISKSFNYRNNW